MPDLPSGTITFLFTDIEGSIRLWEEYPETMREALGRHDALLRAVVETHNGHIFKTMGDAFCAAFATASDALAAALEAQQSLRSFEPSTAETSAALLVKVRVALHTGAAEHRAGDYFGPALNRVARLVVAGHGGQVLLSQATADLVRDALPRGASLRDLGVHRLRDLVHSEAIFQLLHPDLPADFPPLRSLQAFAHNLPVQMTSFLGRERELAEVRRLLGTTRLLTLTGTGGVGKTRLVLQVAADLLEEYPDGVWLVELAPLMDPALLPLAVASALGVREEPNRLLLATLSEYLRPRKMLLVLDNCEHLLSGCAQVADTLRRTCPQLQVLVSSREALGLAGELTWQVPSLPVPDLQHLQRLPSVSADLPSVLIQYEAVRFFSERAAFSRPGFAVTPENALAVAEVCQRLDGIPLALELAAARLKILSVEQVAARLGDRFRLLTGGSRTALPRQQTLRATLDWSYNLLSDPERTLLRRLSVFAGGWTLEAAEAVGAGEPIEAWEVLDLLAALVEKSLVLVGERQGVTRYRLLETVRQYARDRLAESGEEDAARGRHLHYFLALAEHAWARQSLVPDPAPWVTRLEAEHENLLAALEWAAQEEGTLLLRLATALEWFWQDRGSGWRRQWLEAALARDGEARPTLERARGLHGVGRLACLQGDFGLARARLEESVALLRALGEERELSLALKSRGMLAVEEGERARGVEFFEESVALARHSGDKRLLSKMLSELGLFIAHGEPARLLQARPLLEESLALAREDGHRSTIAWALLRLYYLTLDRALLDEALALARASGHRETLAWMLLMLGTHSRQEGDDAAAQPLLDEALSLAEALGDAELLRQTTRELVHLWWRQDPGRARATYEDVLAGRVSVHGRILLWLLRDLGSIAEGLGHAALARRCLEQALAWAREQGQGDLAAGVLLHLGDLEAACGDLAAASARYEQAVQEDPGTGRLHVIWHAWARIGQAARRAGRYAHSRDAYARSLRLRVEQKDLHALAQGLEDLAALAAAQEQWERASRLLGAGEAACAGLGLTPPVALAEEYAQAVSGARSGLGEAVFAAVWQEGRAMSLEQALAYALEEVHTGGSEVYQPSPPCQPSHSKGKRAA